MSRFLTHLLMPLMLANPGLYCGHAHGGSDADDPTHQAGRPHVHLTWLRGHDHDTGLSHTHRHGPAASHLPGAAAESAPAEDHDSDAFFVSTELSLRTPRIEVPNGRLHCLPLADGACPVRWAQGTAARGHALEAALWLDAVCPLSLLDSRLRC